MIKLLDSLEEKYSDFLPTAIIDSSKSLEKEIEGIEKVFNAIDASYSLALRDEDAETLSKVYSGFDNLVRISRDSISSTFKKRKAGSGTQSISYENACVFSSCS